MTYIYVRILHYSSNYIGYNTLILEFEVTIWYFAADTPHDIGRPLLDYRAVGVAEITFPNTTIRVVDMTKLDPTHIVSQNSNTKMPPPPGPPEDGGIDSAVLV
jgi:hypothetical protein